MQNHYRFDRFEVRPAERLLLVDGVPATLGARAFDLLLCLLANRDRTVSKSEVLETVWPGLVVEENNLSVQVSALRKLLGSKAITTVSGRGYRFSIDAVHVDQAGRAAHSDGHQSPAAVPDKPMIAVLPFNVLSEDPRVSLLAKGLAEDVIALLARVPGFFLISHASSFAFRGQHASLPDVARQLGVRFVVEGSVRPTGDVLRVSTQLTEAASGRVLWSGRFDRDHDHAGDLQESIARGIISELEPELTRAEIAHIRRQRPENLDAWSHYHQAVGAIAMQGWGAQALAEARSRLEQSLALDPGFGLGHAHYALLTALARNIGLVPDSPGLVNDALGAAERAIELDDGSSEVLGYAGCALCDLGQKDRGVEILEQALEIDPSNAQAHVALGAAWAMTGKFEQGMAKMRFGMLISPRDRRLGFWGWALGLFLLKADRVDEALAEANTSSRRDPRFHLPRVLQAAALDRQGRLADAGAALAAARRLRPQLTLHEVGLSHGRRVGERMAALWDAGA
ncbi:winged helix-turn-helix domain-containing tetratricopeptide repeat protein [Lacisediminimonas profundi]|uniref:winged helix-turn-helix domain-containing tetratricopeptide repeat protein n=1 Tax=Lacisediminimonas profundi TaxID=2603856 RepID=UPI00138747F2|nr:winged helix-turn-helix domain-containing protein [Lacisediminimonas profundi]